MRAEWRYEPVIRSWVLAEWTEAGEPAVEYGTVSASSLTAIPPAVRRLVQVKMQRQHGVLPPAMVFDGAPGEQMTLTCAGCGAVSYGREAASSRKCPACGHVEGVVAAVPEQRTGDPGDIHSGQSL